MSNEITVNTTVIICQRCGVDIGNLPVKITISGVTSPEIYHQACGEAEVEDILRRHRAANRVSKMLWERYRIVR